MCYLSQLQKSCVVCSIHCMSPHLFTLRYYETLEGLEGRTMTQNWVAWKTLNYMMNIIWARSSLFPTFGKMFWRGNEWLTWLPLNTTQIFQVNIKCVWNRNEQKVWIELLVSVALDTRRENVYGRSLTTTISEKEKKGPECQLFRPRLRKPWHCQIFNHCND